MMWMSATPRTGAGDKWYVLRLWWLNDARTRVEPVDRAAWRSVSRALWNAFAVTSVRAEVVRVIDGRDDAVIWTNGVPA